MKSWFQKSIRRTGRAACECGRCRAHLIMVEEVGWIDPAPGGSYDMCPEDQYGNHAPEDEPKAPTRRSGNVQL